MFDIPSKIGEVDVCHEPLAAAVIISIIEHARVNENISTTYKYLKGPYKRYTGKGADIQKTAATEFAGRVSATGSTAMLEKGNLRLRTRLNDLEQILAKVEHPSSRSACNRNGISVYLPRENSCPLCLSPRPDEQKNYEKSMRSTSLEVLTSTPGRVEISPQGMSEERQTVFIETRLASFK